MTVKNGDRVMLQKNVQSTLAGMIGTVAISDNLIALRIGYDEKKQQPKFVGVLSNLLRKIAKDELNKIDYKQLVSYNYWVGNKFQVEKGTTFGGVKPGDIGSIESIKLAVNELRDVFKFKFNDELHYFEREFIDANFIFYDEEVAGMYGEEVVIKGQSKNFHLPGARIILDNEVVIIQSQDKELGLFKVETMSHEILTVEKENLIPITDAESFLQYPTEHIVPRDYQVNSILTANKNIVNHSLLRREINPDDQIEVILVNCAINAFEDTYLIAIENKFDVPIQVSYMDLKKFFVPLNEINQEAETEEEHVEIEEEHKEELDLSVFTKKDKIDIEDINPDIEFDEPQLENNVEQISVPIQIHELSILGFRFKIDETYSKFSIDGNEKQYEFTSIKNLIIALEQLNKLDQRDNN